MAKRRTRRPDIKITGLETEATKESYSGPCDMEKGLLCLGMELNVQDNPFGSVVRQKGLSTFKPMNLDTGVMRLAGVVYKKNAGDGGMVLNFCPWCGAAYTKNVRRKEIERNDAAGS